MTTIDNIKQRNAAAGLNFFSPGAMRFFASRVCSQTFDLVDGGALFVTSEQFRTWNHRGPRRYTIKRFLPLTADIDTVGEFQAFKDRRSALRAAQALATAWQGEA